MHERIFDFNLNLTDYDTVNFHFHKTTVRYVEKECFSFPMVKTERQKLYDSSRSKHIFSKHIFMKPCKKYIKIRLIRNTKSL